jgi:hypothetical protein
MEATALGSKLKTCLIVIIGRGPGLITVEDLGLNSPFRISYVIPGSRDNIIRQG